MDDFIGLEVYVNKLYVGHVDDLKMKAQIIGVRVTILLKTFLYEMVR